MHNGSPRPHRLTHTLGATVHNHPAVCRQVRRERAGPDGDAGQRGRAAGTRAMLRAGPALGSVSGPSRSPCEDRSVAAWRGQRERGVTGARENSTPSHKDLHTSVHSGLICHSPNVHAVWTSTKRHTWATPHSSVKRRLTETQMPQAGLRGHAEQTRADPKRSAT